MDSGTPAHVDEGDDWCKCGCAAGMRFPCSRAHSRPSVLSRAYARPPACSSDPRLFLRPRM